MKFAMNYSPQAERLVTEQSICLDLFKCPPAWDRAVTEYAPDLLERAGAARPLYLHFPLHAGRNIMASVNWPQVETALAETGTPFVNVHLQAQAEDFPEMRVDTTLPENKARIADILVRDVALITKRFGPERVIVENVSYRGPQGKCLYPCVDPEIICRVAAETGCGLLLDTAHARLTTAALGMDTRDYLARLPVAHLRELHVVGVQSDGTRLRDSMVMGQEDWDVIEWVVQRIRTGEWSTPWAMAFEYGGVGPGLAWRSEAAVMAQQAPRLAALCASVAPPFGKTANSV